MQLFGTSFNVDLGNLRLHFSFGLDEQEAQTQSVRLEDMPRLEIGKY